MGVSEEAKSADNTGLSYEEDLLDIGEIPDSDKKQTDDKIEKTETKKEKPQKPAKQDKPQSQPALTATDPIAFVIMAADSVSESQMSTWAIDILCNATQSIRYRQVFRAAAEQHGEAGVYRLLDVMVRNTHHLKHNQLWLASHPAVASARIAGRGIKMPDGMQPVMADVACRAILERAKAAYASTEMVRKYGNVRIV